MGLAEVVFIPPVLEPFCGQPENVVALGPVRLDICGPYSSHAIQVYDSVAMLRKGRRRLVLRHLGSSANVVRNLLTVLRIENGMSSDM